MLPTKGKHYCYNAGGMATSSLKETNKCVSPLVRDHGSGVLHLFHCDRGKGHYYDPVDPHFGVLLLAFLCRGPLSGLLSDCPAFFRVS